jgi:hypothetical protein
LWFLKNGSHDVIAYSGYGEVHKVYGGGGAIRFPFQSMPLLEVMTELIPEFSISGWACKERVVSESEDVFGSDASGFSPLAAASKEAVNPRAACGVGAMALVRGTFSLVPPEAVAGLVVLLPGPELVHLPERADEVVEECEEIACPDDFPEPAPKINPTHVNVGHS